MDERMIEALKRLEEDDIKARILMVNDRIEERKKEQHDVTDETIKNVSIAEIKPAAFSKINWAAIVAIMATASTLVLGPDFAISPEAQLHIVAVIGMVTHLITIVLKTYFTSTVTPQSAKAVEAVLGNVELAVIPKAELDGMKIDDAMK